MKLYQIDSFTQKIFKGNPAGVCIMDNPLSDEQMQDLASEMNLSETAFVTLGKDSCALRWFTPAREVPLCGHATLATAFVLFEEEFWPKDKQITFNTLNGQLMVGMNQDGSLTMDFPATTPIRSTDVPLLELEKAFGGIIDELLSIPGELILIFKDLETLLNTNPDTSYVATLAGNGVIVSAWSDNGVYDFASRYFAPNLGIKEDPVTGFMHTILTPYWSGKKNLKNFKAFQASERSGKMLTELRGDRVLLTGSAVKVFETEFSF